MGPFDRLGSVATALTVAVMFVIVVLVSPLLESLCSSSKFLSILAGVAGSLAVYRAVARGLVGLFRRSLRWYIGYELQAAGWILVQVKGDHHHFKHDRNPAIVTVPHPKRDLSLGVLKSIQRITGIKLI